MESNHDDWVHGGVGSEGYPEYSNSSKQSFLAFQKITWLSCSHLQKLEQTIKYGTLYIIQQVIMMFFFLSKIALAPVVYPIYWGFSLILLLCAFVKKTVNVAMNGFYSILVNFSKGCFSQKIHYAVLKQSGIYLNKLKGSGLSLEEVFTSQLYDYSIRKFMSLPTIEKDVKVAQVQPWSHIGMSYLKNFFKLEHTSYFHNDASKLEKIRIKIDDIETIVTDYSAESPKNPHDIFILFNRTKDLESYSKYVDMIKIIGYIRRNLNENGYVVFGNAFTSTGEVSVFEELILSFGFSIAMKQNVTINITNSRKILQKQYKDRKIAWVKDKILGKVSQILNGDNLIRKFLQSIWMGIEKLTGIKYSPSQYYIYILEINI